MPGLSPHQSQHLSPLGQRRGVSDLAFFSLDLAWADKRAESVTAARSRAYPSPPMSGSPPPPPTSNPEAAGDRSQAPALAPTHALAPAPAPHQQQPQHQQAQSQDVYRGYPPHPGHAEGARGHLPSTLPPPPSSIRAYPPLPPPTEPTDRLGYYRPADDPMSRRLSYPPPPGAVPHIQTEYPAYPIPRPSTMTQPGYAPASQSPVAAGSSFEPARANSGRKAKGHVASACVPCKKAHLRCDSQRPCSRCLMNGKEESCIDVQHKKRGRPRLRDDRDSRFDSGTRFSAGPDPLRRPLGVYPGGGSLGTGESMAPRYIERASIGDANIYAPPLSITTRPPEPVAFLTMDMEVVKASTTFSEAIGIPTVGSRALFDIIIPSDRERAAEYQRQLQEDRARQEPRYLPPIFGKQESERVIQALGFSFEEVSRFQLDKPGHLTFQSMDGQPRSHSVQFGLVKVESIYVVVVRLNLATRFPYPSPSPHSRDPTVATYPYSLQAQHQHQQQVYAQHTPVSATFDPNRPRYDQSTVRPGTAPPTGGQLLAGISPGVSPGMPAYSASPSRPDYVAGPSSYQVPRSELPGGSQAGQPASFQLPPIRAQPQQPLPTSEAGSSRDERGASRVDIGGLIERPDQAQGPRQ